MFPMNDLFTSFARSYDVRRETEMSLLEYLEGISDSLRVLVQVYVRDSSDSGGGVSPKFL